MGEKGKVYAVDIEPLAVGYATQKVKNLGLSNVEVLLSEESHIPLPDDVYVYNRLEEGG